VVTDGNSCGNSNCRATVALHNASAATPEGWKKTGREIAAELCLEAGTDVELGSTLNTFTQGAIDAGFLNASTVSRSNIRLYGELIRSGYLDRTPADKLGPYDVDTAAHRQLAFEAATDAMILLKNDGDFLPLLPNKGGKLLKIALVGPHLNSTEALLAGSGYAGENRLIAKNTIEGAFRRRAAASKGIISITGTALGCDMTTGCAQADLPSITTAVQDADVVIAFVGLNPTSGAPTAPVRAPTNHLLFLSRLTSRCSLPLLPHSCPLSPTKYNTYAGLWDHLL
jgi:hypothetical protein